jgi:tetrahydromethanopterin S-methyltransferase subunit B
MAAYISKEYEVILDAAAGLVGEARPDVVTLDLEPISKQLKELETIVDDLLASLNPGTPPRLSAPRRGGVYKTAGFLTNVVTGLVLGSLLFAIIIFAYLVASNPAFLKVLLGG